MHVCYVLARHAARYEEGNTCHAECGAEAGVEEGEAPYDSCHDEQILASHVQHVPPNTCWSMLGRVF